jgi:hypothetical protein
MFEQLEREGWFGKVKRNPENIFLLLMLVAQTAEFLFYPPSRLLSAAIRDVIGIATVGYFTIVLVRFVRWIRSRGMK